MSFPTSPTNNQTTVVNGITYVYSLANNAWTRVTANNITVSGNITSNRLITGNIDAGNITTSGTSGNISGVNYIFAGNYVYANGVSILSALNSNIGAFYTYANTKIGTNTNSNLVVVATTTSTSTTTGALVVRGGMGIAGDIYSGANVVITNGIFWAANGLAYSSAAGNNPFDSDSNLGLVTDSVSSLFDLGFTTDVSVTESYDLGSLVSNSVVYGTSIIANTISGTRLITGTDIVAGVLTASNVTGAILVSTGSANIAGNVTAANLLIANVTISANTVNTSAAQVNGVDIATVDNYDLDDVSSYTDGVRQVFPLTYNLSNVSLNSPWQLTVAVNGIPLPAFNSSPNAAILWQSYVFPANKGYTLGSNSTIKFAEAPAARSDMYIRKQPGTTPSVIKVYPFKPIDIMIGY